uniref:GST N-terminal domain-containing protein n=1 Tax=Chrysotila carterae TaxID=13221 RepID=A0A7S4C0M9_CHRCT|mmetsp:Transcript_57350/g.124610  ORF Transcript_57350/g.124610 Transcript_57350/m.124610 type:complete len:225 (+) Transcript_57350:149-823(+)|eukprot:1190827-Pleurochrysis_carterae.AAC.1
MGAASSTPVLFKYLNLGALNGRGGVVRFFMLVHDIAFTEELYSLGEEWTQKKQQLIASGENPSGTVPVLEHKGVTLTQHIALMRYLAREHGLTSGSAYGDYVQDLVADEYQGFRDAWVGAAFGGDEEATKKFKEVIVPSRLQLFDDLYAKFKQHDVYLSVSRSSCGRTGGRPLWGDTALYGMIQDLILSKMMTQEQLAAYSHLRALYKAYGAQPAVAQRVASKE